MAHKSELRIARAGLVAPFLQLGRSSVSFQELVNYLETRARRRGNCQAAEPNEPGSLLLPHGLAAQLNMNLFKGL